MGRGVHALSSQFQSLWAAWTATKTEECPVCRPYFHYTRKLQPVFSLDPALLDPAHQERCHGCWIAGFALSFFLHLVGPSWAGQEITGFYFNPHRDGADVVLETVEGGGSRKTVELEMFKTYRSRRRVDDGNSGGTRTRTRAWARARVWGWSLPRLIRTPTSSAAAALPSYIENCREARPISGFTGSEAAFETIFRWFEACSASHAACQDGLALPSSAPMPTRLIDIRDKAQLRLVDGADAAAGHSYVCLSHRWGEEAKMPRCTRATLDALRKHIPWDSLTRTFQEAILFVQAFAQWHARRYAAGDDGPGPVRYIWIDSLCIVQDSADDWAREAQLMCAVYEGALLTVAAAAGGAAEGCFSEADPTHKGFDVTHPRRPDPRLYLRRRLPDHSHDARSLQTDRRARPASSLELFTRGWVLQERLLSRRFVVFGPNELVWECFQGVDCECGAHPSRRPADGQRDARMDALFDEIDAFVEHRRAGDPNYVIQPLPVKVAYRRSLVADDRPSRRRRRNLLNWWRRLVEDYSALDLTKESDRIPAVAGLATQFQRSAGTADWVAGHWPEGLPLDLAWFTEVPYEARMQQRGLTGGPSWSWASACGRIRMPREVEEDNSTLDVCMEVLALPRPGDVAASIHVRCVVLGGMKDDRTGTDNDDDVLQYSQAYYPDAKEDETREAKKKTRHLLAVKITYPGSLGWLLIRVEEVADHPRRRYRRLGVLELSAKVDHPVQVSADREAAMRACFQEVATETIELV